MGLRAPLEAGFDAGARIEVIAQGVADKVERQYCEHHGERWKQDEMGRVEQMGAAVVQHGSPTGCGWRHAESEKTHGGFGEDGSSHADCGLDDHGLNDVRENVADDDAEIARSESTRGFDEFTFARGEDLSAHQAGVADPASERQCQNQIEYAGAAERYERNGQQDPGEREEGIHQDYVDEAVDASAVVTGNGADDEAESERGDDDTASYQHGDTRAVDDARENVAAEFVGAEPVRVGWRVEARRQIYGGGILRRNPGSEKGEDHEDDDQHDSGCCQWVVA